MLRMFRIISTIVLLLVTTSGLAAAPEASSTLPDRDASMIAEAYHLWESLGETVWPGWTTIEMPIIYIRSDFEYAIGFETAPRGFESLGFDRRIGRDVFVRPRTFDPHLTASFFVDGTPAVVIGTSGTIGREPGWWVLTVVHEMFHVLQDSRGSVEKIASLKIGPGNDPSWQLNWPFPYDDPEVMRLVHLQGYPIFLGFTASDDADARYDAGTVMDAVGVYRDYLKLKTGSRTAYDYSRFQEATEGVAFYTERRLAKAAAEGGYQPLPAFEALSDAKPYPDIWSRLYESRIFLVKHAGRATQSRLTFYHLGMGKALLLDRIAPEWKKRYFEKDLWLDSLLADALESAGACATTP